MHKYGISFQDIMILNDAGLLNENALINVGLELAPNKENYFFGYKKTIKITNIHGRKLIVSCHVYALKEAGKELLPVVLDNSIPSPELGYFSDCIDMIRKENIDKAKLLKIEIADYEANKPQ